MTGYRLWQDDGSGGREIVVGGLQFPEVVCGGAGWHDWADIEAGDGSSVDGGEAACDGGHPGDKGFGQVAFADAEEFGEVWQFFGVWRAAGFAWVEDVAAAAGVMEFQGCINGGIHIEL